MLSTNRIRVYYTLIELLVTLSTILILISLLHPLFNNLKERFEAIECTNNLKQIGVSVQLYANDNHGDIPKAGSTWNLAVPNWQKILYREGYMDYSFSVCPSLRPFSTSEDTPPLYNSGYGVEIWNNKATGSWWTSTITNLTLLKDPSDYGYAVDSVNPAGYTTPIQILWLTANNKNPFQNCVHRRHDQKANVQFLDGHVAPLDIIDLDNLGQQCFRNSYPYD